MASDFDVYNVPDALSPEAPTDASVFLNGLCGGIVYYVMLMDFLPDARTRAAIHAPTSKDWVEITSTVFAPNNGSSKQLFSEVHNELM